MNYRIKRKLKEYFRQLLHIVIIAQLCLFPSYSYSSDQDKTVGESSSLPNSGPPTVPLPSAEESLAELQNNLKEITKNFESRNTPEQIEQMIPISKLAEAIELDKVDEYLRENPQIGKKMDYFLLSDQRVESVEHYFDSEKNGFAERVSHTVHLNDYGTRPVEEVFKSVRVRYNEKAKELVFEGIAADTVLLRQYVPDVDIVDYVHDKELLLLFDRNRGLLSVDMFFAQTYLGRAPVPFVEIALPSVKQLKEKFSEGSIDTLSMEFVNRGVRPPDVFPDSIEENIDKTFENNRLFQAGDFMISYNDKEGKKTLAQFLKRMEIAGWLKAGYNILDVMIKTVAPQLVDYEGLEQLRKEVNVLKVVEEADRDKVGQIREEISSLETAETLDTKKLNQLTEEVKALKEKYALKERSFGSGYDYTLSTLFSKNAIYKLSQAAASMKSRVAHLGNLSSRDTFVLEDWYENFNKISTQIQDQHRKERQKVEGQILNTKEIVKMQNNGEREPVDPQVKNIRAKALQIIAHILNYTNKHKISTTVIGGTTLAGSFTGYFYPEQFVLLVNKIMPVFNNIIYGNTYSAHFFSSTPNLFLMITFLPGVVILLSYLYQPSIKGLRKIAPKSLSLFGKVYHPKGYMEDVVNKWKDVGVIKRIVALGVRFVAYAIYPFWNYLAKGIGQPHFLSAVHKDLNPFRKIHPDSDIGEKAGIQKVTRLGSQGILNPQWRENEEFNQQRKLQNVAMEKELRTKSIVWLLASLAVAGKTEVGPDQLLIHGLIAHLDEIKKVHNEESLKLEVLWVMKNLLRDIKKIEGLDELDIRRELAEIDPAMVKRYYERALELAQEVRQKPAYQKKIRRFLNTGWRASVIGNLTLSSIAGVNEAQHNMLKNIPSDFIRDRVINEASTDHLMTTALPFFTTERADFHVEHLYQAVLNSDNFSWSGKPHLNEVAVNVLMHFFVAGGQRSMTFTKPESVINNIKAEHDGRALYEPVETYTKPTKGYVQKEWPYYFNIGLKYLASMGKKDNLGDVAWRSYVARLRSVQMTLAFYVIIRLITTSQTIEQAVYAFALFHFAAQWMFGWPWDILIGGSKINANVLAENKEKVERLKIKLSQLNRKTYLEESVFRVEYESALNEVIQLYTVNGLKRKLLNSGIQEVNPELWTHIQSLNGKTHTGWTVSEDISTMQETAGKLTDLIAETPPLPTKDNKTANFIITGLLGGVLTTYLFVVLSVMTFSPEFLNFETLLMWAGINYSAYFALYHLYKKGLKERWEAIRGWKGFAYGKEGFLKLGGAARNACRRAFR